MIERIQKLERMVKWLYCKVKNTAIGGIQSIVAGDNITVDNSDPANPVVSSTGGGSDGGVIKALYESNANTNAFTDNEKTKLAGLENYNDSSIISALGNKVDKVSGKSLSTNDYSDSEKTKLAGLNNFDPTPINEQLALKANQLTTYTKTEVDGLVKGEIITFNTDLTLLYNISKL